MSLRTSLTYIAVRVASGALAMATLALVVRGLGPERYGQLTLGLATAAAVTLVLFNPLNATLARFYGEPGRRVLLIGLLRNVLLGIGVVLAGAAWLAEAAGWSVLAGQVLIAAALMALAQGMFDFSGQYLAAAQKSGRYSAQFLGKAVLNFVLCALVLRAGGGAAAVLGAMALAFAVAALLAGEVWRFSSVARMQAKGRNPGTAAIPVPDSAALHPGYRAELARFAGPLLLTSLLGYLLLWGDRYLLQQLVPLAELGRYGALTDLAQQTLGLIFSGLCTAWYPRMVLAWGAEEGEPPASLLGRKQPPEGAKKVLGRPGDFPGRAEAQRLYERYAALGLAVCLPAGVGFALLLPEVVPLLFGAAYTQLPPGLLSLVSAAAMLAGVKAYYLDQPLLLGKRVWWHAASIGVSAGAGLLLAWLLVPRLGTPGAALGLVLGQLGGGLVSLWGGRGVLRPRLAFALAWPPLLACTAMAGLLMLWPAADWFGLVAKVVSGAAVYAGVMWWVDFDGVRTARSGLRPRAEAVDSGRERRRIILFANTDWFLYNFKRSLAEALRARGDEVVLLSPPGEYGPRLRELGFRWEPLPVSRSGVNPAAELAVVRRITALYRELQPDLVHHFTIKCVIYGSFAARRAGVRAIVNSVTGLGFALLAASPKARLIRPVVLGLYRLALRGTQVIFQNRDNRDTLAAYGVLSRSGVQVIAGDGIDTQTFAPAETTPLAPVGERGWGRGEKPVVLMMARLLHSKGIADFVAAAKIVHAALSDVRFQLAGAPDPGNPESVTEAELAAWRTQAEVEFLGQRSDVLALNQSASVVVLASTQGEGIPRALLEGAACGVPMVATDVPGCRDVVVDGETGRLVPPAQPERLAAALLELLQDEALRVRMGAAAREHVMKNFSDEVVIAQTVAVYAKALGAGVQA